MEYKNITTYHDNAFQELLTQNAELGFKVISSGMTNSGDWWAVMEREVKP